MTIQVFSGYNLDGTIKWRSLKDARKVAVEENVCVYTAMQAKQIDADEEAVKNLIDDMEKGVSYGEARQGTGSCSRLGS